MASSTDRQTLSLTIDLLHLPATMLTENEVKQRIQLLESLLLYDEDDNGVIRMRLRECINTLAYETYFESPEFFKSPGQDDDVTSEHEETSKESPDPITIDDNTFPTISRYFEHWVGKVVSDNDFKPNCFRIHQNTKEVPTVGDLLQQLEDYLNEMDNALDTNQLHNDAILRRFFYVKIATTLHDIHGKMFCNESTFPKLDTENKKVTKCVEDQIENMVCLGLILMRMCYPPFAPEQEIEYLHEFRDRIQKKNQFAVDEHITHDAHLLILLLGTSEKDRIYLNVGLCSLYRWYDNLSEIGKDEPIAVARAYEIEKLCVYTHIRNALKRELVPGVPEFRGWIEIE